MRIQRGRELGYLLALTVAISVLQYVFSFCRRLLFLTYFRFRSHPKVKLIGKPYNSTRTRQQWHCVYVKSERSGVTGMTGMTGMTDKAWLRKAGKTGKPERPEKQDR